LVFHWFRYGFPWFFNIHWRICLKRTRPTRRKQRVNSNDNSETEIARTLNFIIDLIKKKQGLKAMQSHEDAMQNHEDTIETPLMEKPLVKSVRRGNSGAPFNY